MVPESDPWDGFFYEYQTLKEHSYRVAPPKNVSIPLKRVKISRTKVTVLQDGKTESKLAHESRQAQCSRASSALDQKKQRSVYIGKHKSTLQPLYNWVRYNTVLDITRSKMDPKKCIDYIEK